MVWSLAEGPHCNVLGSVGVGGCRAACRPLLVLDVHEIGQGALEAIGQRVISPWMRARFNFLLDGYQDSLLDNFMRRGNLPLVPRAIEALSQLPERVSRASKTVSV